MIELDLNNLTQAMLEEALPNMGVCSYSAPCIIGALMTPEQREELPFDSMRIGALVTGGFVSFPLGQLEVAKELQFAFDHESEAELRHTLAAYGLAQ